MNSVSEYLVAASGATSGQAQEASRDARAVLRVSALHVSVSNRRDGNVAVVEDVDLRVNAGELLAVVGESGAGKTLLCRALMGLLPQGALATGSIVLAGNETVGMAEPRWRQLRGRVASMVFQDSSGSLNPTMSIGDQVIESIRVHHVTSKRSARQMAEALLDVLLLPDAPSLLRAYPHELSGGMQQRVSIAIAVACRPQLLVADEPTRSLDMVAQAKVMQLFRHLQRELRMAVILVTHDLALVGSVATGVAVMYRGRIVETLPAGDLRGARVPYTRALLEASTRSPRVPHQKLFEPSLAGGPRGVGLTGCAYAPHCERADPACHTAPPRPVWESAERMYMCRHPLGAT